MTKPAYIWDLEGNRVAAFDSIQEAAAEYGVSKTLISRCAAGTDVLLCKYRVTLTPTRPEARPTVKRQYVKRKKKP